MLSKMWFYIIIIAVNLGILAGWINLKEWAIEYEKEKQNNVVWIESEKTHEY